MNELPMGREVTEQISTQASSFLTNFQSNETLLYNNSKLCPHLLEICGAVHLISDETGHSLVC